MKRIAVAGTGTIGLMLGSLLTRGGYGASLVSLFRPQTARELSARGVTIEHDGVSENIPVRAVYAQDLASDEMFDVIFLTCKSNDTETALDALLPHLADTGYICSLQNGINDYVIAARAGKDRVIPCVCFAGGQTPEPCRVITHDGHFIIGELSGETTERLTELCETLSCAKRVELSGNIIAARWRKLSEVCLTVPAAALTGWPMFSGLDDWRTLRLFGRLACEVMDVQRAAGNEPEPILGFSRDEWAVLANERCLALEAGFAASAALPPSPGGGEGPMLSPTDAYTQDIAKGLPLEIGYTNGYVARLGRELGVPTPTLDRELELIGQIAAGQLLPGPELLDIILEL